MLKPWLALFLLSSKLFAAPASGFVAREWGVLDVRANGLAKLLTLPPKQRSQAREMLFREPVIYIESADKQPLALTVRLPSGVPTAIYPHTETSEDSIRWPLITFDEPAECQSANAPDEAVRALLGDQGADEFYVNGQAASYLFYEAKLPHFAGLQIYSKDGSYQVKNVSGKELQRVFISIPYGAKGAKGFLFPTLAPGRLEDFVPDARAWDAYKAPDLQAQGFSAVEAGVFQRIWGEAAKRPVSGEPGHIHAFYQLSPEACESLSVLEFNPAPQKLTRAIFVREDLTMNP